MSYRTLPALWFLFIATSAAHAQGLEDFSKVSRAQGKEVVVVDQSGLVRQGIVEAATEGAVTLRFGSSTQSFPRASVARVERLRDGSADGALKGAVLAAVVGVLVVQGYPPGSDRGGMLAAHVATWAGIGWLLDATQTNRQTIFRAAAPAPTASLKLSFSF